MNQKETKRQYEFMEKAKGYVQKQSEELEDHLLTVLLHLVVR